MEIRDRVVVVTGGGNGIGEALCRAFAGAGAAAVVVADLEADSATVVAGALSCGVAHALDVRDEAAVAQLVADTERQFGRIDLFCSNAGIVRGDGEPWYATSAINAVWQTMWELHVMAHVYAARACLPGMIARGEGYFLQTVSAAGLLNQIGDAAYSTTKHAALGFAEALAITHGDQGIRVSALCPQAVATRMIAGMADGGTAGVDGVISAEVVAACALEGIRDERFLLLPHPEAGEHFRGKALDYERWIGGMRKLRRRYGNPTI